MNQETCLEDVEEVSDYEEARRAQAAILCRNIRLFIAAHPGCVFKDMKEQFGHIRLCMSLNRLSALGLVRSEGSRFDGTPVKWYVVPQ